MMKLNRLQARRIWLKAQRLDSRAPFGSGPAATRAAIEHLGYVQIDTINVIERCHHHILFTRIPQYSRRDLHRAQSLEKSVFEYWTHALSYVPTRDFRFFIPDMKRTLQSPSRWFQSVKPTELRRVLKMIRAEGPLSIRDIEDEVLVEKEHEWASRKPSKKALQLGFYAGKLAVSERLGMLKKYELLERHFNWPERPRAATPTQILEYRLERALRSQGVVSLDSICHLDAKSKVAIRALAESKVKRGELIAVAIEGADGISYSHWTKPETIDARFERESERVCLLSPFDPLVIQRKRLKIFFDYEHRFEAYIPKQKRVFGYFALPVLLDDRIVAAIDLKTDRLQRRLLIQKWTWVGRGRSPIVKRRIEEELALFERFQLGD